MIGATATTTAAAIIGQRNLEEANRRFDKEFNSQISTLRRQNCPKTIIRNLEKKRAQVIARAAGMIPSGSKRIPFLPIIPSGRLSVHEQLSMIKSGNVPGCTLLDTAYLTDLVEMPKEECFIFSIEDGTRTLGWTPVFGEKVFKAQPNRRGLNIPGIISLCRHTDVLSRQNVDAILSRFKDKIPFLWLIEREPRLCADKADIADPRWGIPSCNAVAI